MNFDFYFKRTSFRTMSLFYKIEFKPYFDRWKKEKKASKEIGVYLAEYTRRTFPGLIESMGPKELDEFIELLKLLVFSHRHNKNDPFLSNPIVDFTVVRDPMYKYSKIVQDRFFNHPTFAFLFTWFTRTEEALAFAKSKFEENSDQRYPDRMLNELEHLGSVAEEHLIDACRSQPAHDRSHIPA